jgi:hypothetical protein
VGGILGVRCGWRVDGDVGDTLGEALVCRTEFYKIVPFEVFDQGHPFDRGQSMPALFIFTKTGCKR